MSGSLNQVFVLQEEQTIKWFGVAIKTCLYSKLFLLVS